MKRAFAMFVAVVLSACQPATLPPPLVTPAGDDRFLIDPRTGYPLEGEPVQFETAWRHVLAGNEAEARRRLAELRATYPPAILAEAAVEMRAGNLDAAAQLIAEAKRASAEWIAPRVYEAELAFRQNQARAAFTLYRDLVGQPGVPDFVSERVTALQSMLFNDLVAQAASAADAEAVRLLRDALTFNPGAMDVRVQLASRLVNLEQFDEARREIDPVLGTAEAVRPAVQEILAEIDAGRGRFQEAINRYDRLARTTKDPRYSARLEQIK